VSPQEEEEMAFSVGIGLTNECNLRCPHCYRPDMVLDRLSLPDIQRVCESIPVKSMNLGVGENGLHPEYHAILDYLAEHGIVSSITSNGLSTERLTDTELKRFRSVEFSLDFPTEQEHDAFRGAGNWRTVTKALERCARLDVPVTVTAVMMRINYDKLAALASVAASFGANLRVNVYQPSKTDRFSVSYEQFWQGFTQLLESTRIVATTEPVLAAVLGIEGFVGPG
jgi:MoaA/NifB/PqqE/SkfB family radical SAM enzyme